MAMAVQDPPVGGLAEQGCWLVAHHHQRERGEAAWLRALARFDLDAGWALDGQLGCAEWLMWRLDMARATAYEKVHVARQLERRPLLADALEAGRISYSAMRVICRIEDPSPEVDAALVELAEAGTVADVETAVRFYQAHAAQHIPPPNPYLGRGLRVRHHGDGTATLEVTASQVEIYELLAAIDAFADHPGVQSAAADMSDSTGSAGVQSAAADMSGGEAGVPWSVRRSDALLDLARVGLANLDTEGACGSDRYMIHVVVRAGEPPTRLDGSPIDNRDAQRLLCDCARVDHGTGADGEPLYLGRRQRDWSTAQRRATMVRDRGHCRFPGCRRRWVDVHHVRAWEAGGYTDISNGMLLCRSHHTIVHKGFSTSGDANHSVIFHRPNRSVLARSPVCDQ